MKSLIDKIKDLNDVNESEFVPFYIEEHQVGMIHKSNIELLDTSLFIIDKDKILLSKWLETPNERTEKVHQFNLLLKEKGIINWRNEYYSVTTSFGEPDLMVMERGATKFFGIINYGIHINGFTTKRNKPMMWIATRSMTKPTFPGRYDHLAAGGCVAGYNLKESVIKECYEEAKVNSELASNAIPAGIVSYTKQKGTLIESCILFVYDLETSSDFQPEPNDGEVESFQLMNYNQILDIVRNTDKFKDNVNLVIIDFMIRHGIITPEEPNYVDIIRGLRA